MRLGDAMAVTTIPVTDLERAPRFYGETLGLRLIGESGPSLRSEAGNRTQILRRARDLPTLLNAIQVAEFVLLREGRAQDAAVVCGAVDAIREPLGELATGLDILSIEDPKIGARRILGDAAFEEASARGRTLDLDDLLAPAPAGSASAPEPARPPVNHVGRRTFVG